MNRKLILIGVAVVVVLVIVIAVPCALLLGKEDDEPTATEKPKTVMQRAQQILDETPLVDGLTERLGGLVLKDKQEEALKSLLDGKDVFAVLPTGFGKSLIYQSFVIAKEMEGRVTDPCCLVIVPLRSIVEEQVNYNDFGMTAKGFEKSSEALKDIKSNKYKLIYASAEQALSSEFLSLLKDDSSELKKSLSLIVVDESHTVETWGKGKKRGKKVSEPFRKDFGELSTLRSFCSGVPLLAITGTATKKMQTTIMQQLAMGENTVMLNISPNRENIRFSVIKTTKTDQLGYLGWLIDIIKERNLLSPKTIIFCATMHDVAKVFGFLLAELGDSAYVAEKPRIPENRLVGIYHSMTLPKYKSRVSHSFKDNVGQVRIVIATSALSMGVNFPDVRYVIHIGPARSVADHIQEAGRAGRDGASAHNVVLYHGNQLAHYEEDIKQFARSGSCVRKALFKDFDDVPSNNPPHECCSSCDNNCVCSGEECSRERFPFDEPKGMTST
ncbi:3 flap structured DNA binding [Porites harrisoni]